MKTLHAEARLEALVARLFRRWPGLVGFAVQDAGELVLTEMETQPWSLQPHELLGEVSVALLDFVDEEPGALALLCGRTFARTLH
ncbi:MAG: hypothetical protein ACT4P3_02500 [Betaproteobacteria bacterium]